jgi:hypothetical protein
MISIGWIIAKKISISVNDDYRDKRLFFLIKRILVYSLFSENKATYMIFLKW